MLDGAVGFSMSQIPAAGPGVELLLLRGIDPVQLRLEHLAQQGVHPESGILAVEGCEQEVRLRKPPQFLGRAGVVQDRIAEVA